MPSKHRVWLVDDREENRRAFEQKHRTEWEVRTFEQPDDVLAALSQEAHPNALLCDIYFYADAEKREEIEEARKKVPESQLRQEAEKPRER